MKIKISKRQWEMMGKQAVKKPKKAPVQWSQWKGSTEKNDDISEHLNSMINSGKTLSDEDFELCNEEQKRKYISKTSYDDLTENQQKYKQKMIEDIIALFISKGWDLPDEYFNKCNSLQKRQYLNARISSGLDEPLSGVQLSSCNIEQKRRYIDSRLTQKRVLSDNEFHFSNTAQKISYIIFLFNKRQLLSDIQFLYCDDEVKKFYVDSKLFRKMKLTPSEQIFFNSNLKK